MTETAVRCPTCLSHGVTPADGNMLSRRTGAPSNDVSLLTAIDGAVGHKMRIWSSQKKELEAQLETKSKELQTVIAQRQIREDTLKKELEDSKKKLEERLRELDDQVRAFRSQCESKIKEEQQRSSRVHQELQREINQRDHELTKARTRLAESGRTIGTLETERVKLNGDLRECRSQKDALQSKVKDLQHDFDLLKSATQNKADSVRQVEERYQQKAAEADKRSDEQERILAEHVNRIEGLQKALVLARQVQKQTVDDKRKLDDDLAKKEYEVKRLSAELDGTKLALVRLTSEHSSCACRIADLQKAVNNLKLSSTTASSSAVHIDKAEHKQQLVDLRKQVNQLGVKLEASRAERNELECRLAESEAAVSRWRETSNSLKNELTRLAKEHDHEVNELRMKILHAETLLKKASAQEAALKSQLHDGSRNNNDSELQHQIEAIRSEGDHLRSELKESRKRIETLSQERSSLYEQLAEIGQLKHELDNTRRQLKDSVEEASHYKKLSAERPRRKVDEKYRFPSVASPAPTISPSFTNVSTGKLLNGNVQNQVFTRSSVESPTPSQSQQQEQQTQSNFEIASIGQTTMISPAFRQIPLVPPADSVSTISNDDHRNPQRILSVEQQFSSSTMAVEEANQPIGEKAVVKEPLVNSILLEWERHCANEAKSLELALSSQLGTLTAASDKILTQINALSQK